VRSDDPQTDFELFRTLVAQGGRGARADAPLAELCARWRRPAAVVVTRIQASYGKGVAADVEELFQEALSRLLSRGLSQWHGLSQVRPGDAANPRTFFLRIVKHVAIDHYRRQREELAPPPTSEEEEAWEESPASRTRAVRRAEEAHQARSAQAEYRTAFRRLQAEHPKEAEAWDLYHHQDVDDHEACAEQLQISVANSYKRVSRAQAWLRSYVLELRAEEATC
jgi:RNA polymerase sigma-70 factor (ECF subfamily)